MELPVPAHPTPGHPGVIARLAGAWRGRLVDRQGATESFNLHGGIEEHVRPEPFQHFTTPSGISTSVTLLEASDRCFAALVGPYVDPRAGELVVTVLEGCLDDGQLEGAFYTRHHGGRATLREGRFTAARVEPVHRAA